MRIIKGFFGKLGILAIGLLTASLTFAQCPVDPSFNVDQYCDSIVFQNTSVITGGNVTSVKWIFGDGDVLLIEDPPFYDPVDHVYDTPQEYIVTLEVYNDDYGGCMESYDSTIRIFYPSAAFQTVVGCPGDSTVFIDKSVHNADSLVGWFWDFGDGNNATGEDTVANIYAEPGLYTIYHAVENNYGCIDTIEKDQLIDGPEAGFISDTACFGLATHFYDTSTYLQSPVAEWNWDFGNGNTSTSPNPEFTFDTPGIHPVKLVITTDAGCMDSIIQDVVVGSFPEASFEIIPACKNDTTLFFDLSAPNADFIDHWEWDFGDGSPFAHHPDTAHVYIEDNVFDVKLTVTNNLGCSDDTLVEYTISTPRAGFMSDSVCFGDLVFFNDTSSSATYPITDWYWDFDDGNTSQAEDTVYNYQSHGLYNVMHVAFNSMGCSDTAYNYVLVDTLPVADFSHTVSCLGQLTCFSDESVSNSDTLTDWYWYFGDGNISTLQNPCHMYSDTGSYVVELFVTNTDGCLSEVKTDTIYVSKPPVAEFDADKICFGDTTYFINLTDTQSVKIAGWQWVFGDSLSGTSDTSYMFEPYHVFSNPGVYNVKLFVENISGCMDSITHSVQVDSIPEAQFLAPDTIAVGKQFVIADQSVPHGSPILNRYWDFGDGQNATNINPVLHTYNTPGQYNICLAVEDVNGCSHQMCDSVTVSGLPSANFLWASDITYETFFYDESMPAYTLHNWF